MAPPPRSHPPRTRRARPAHGRPRSALASKATSKRVTSRAASWRGDGLYVQPRRDAGDEAGGVLGSDQCSTSTDRERIGLEAGDVAHGSGGVAPTVSGGSGERREQRRDVRERVVAARRPDHRAQRRERILGGAARLAAAPSGARLPVRARGATGAPQRRPTARRLSHADARCATRAARAARGRGRGRGRARRAALGGRAAGSSSASPNELSTATKAAGASHMTETQSPPCACSSMRTRGGERFVASMSGTPHGDARGLRLLAPPRDDRRGAPWRIHGGQGQRQPTCACHKIRASSARSSPPPPP